MSAVGGGSWYWLLGLLFIISSKVTGQNIPYNTLVDLYWSTNGPYWLNGWSSNVHYCYWFGVACDNYQMVVYLNLRSNSLVGTIPSSLGTLTALTYLDLSSNSLSGTIPPSLGNLSRARYLYLAGNYISGPVPSSLGYLSSLIELYLAQNRLTGSLPSSLGNLLQLQYFNIYRNQLNGTIPSSFGALRNLQQLNLKNNKLTGTIPSSLQSMTKLLFLDLSNNYFCGGCFRLTVSTNNCDLRGSYFNCSCSSSFCLNFKCSYNISCNPLLAPPPGTTPMADSLIVHESQAIPGEKIANYMTLVIRDAVLSVPDELRFTESLIDMNLNSSIIVGGPVDMRNSTLTLKLSDFELDKEYILISSLNSSIIFAPELRVTVNDSCVSPYKSISNTYVSIRFVNFCTIRPTLLIIVGAIVGGLFGMALLIGTIYFIYLKRHTEEMENDLRRMP